MGNARPHSKTGRKSAARNSVRKRGRNPKAPRGMKTRICALLKGIKDFLLSDSYMYGPVAQSRLTPSPAAAGTGADDRLREGKSSDQAGEAAMAAEGSEDSAGRGSPQHPEPGSEHVDGGGSGDSKPEAGTPRPVRIRLQRVERSTQVVRHHAIVPHACEAEVGAGAEAAEEGDESVLGSDPEQGNNAEEESSGPALYEPLQADEAAQVLQQLVGKYGGRYSRELGIDVDAGEEEVERWFLASLLFNRRASFHPSAEVLRRLEEGGVRTAADVLAVDERRLTELLESVEEPDAYNRRLAARLHKAAQSLQTQLGGRISALRGVPDYDELLESVGRIYGVGPSTAAVFLRELRGTWPGAAPELGTRPVSALRHLRLLDADCADAPHSLLMALQAVAGRGGVDVRDAETALIRFGSQHARFYRRCAGGLECETWHSVPAYTPQKHVK